MLYYLDTVIVIYAVEGDPADKKRARRPPGHTRTVWPSLRDQRVDPDRMFFPSGQPHLQGPHGRGTWRERSTGKTREEGQAEREGISLGLRLSRARACRAACQRCGSSSAKPSAGCVGRRSSTSRRYAKVLMRRCLHVAVKLNSTAAVWPPLSLPRNNQLIRPMPINFNVRSLRLLSMCKSPSVV